MLYESRMCRLDVVFNSSFASGMYSIMAEAHSEPSQTYNIDAELCGKKDLP